MNSSDKFDKTFGEIFKDLRSSKKFSRTEAADGVMSDTGLSHFESGYSMAGFGKVHQMLKNINVTLLEFDDTYNRTKLKQDVLLYDTAVSLAYLNKDVGKLKFLLTQIENEIKHFKHVKKYKIDKWRIEAILKQLDPTYVFPRNDIPLIKNYLMSLGEWGLYDVHLFSYSVNIFTSDDDLEELTKQMIEHTLETISLHNVEHAFIQALLNVIDSFIARKNSQLAKKSIERLKSRKIHDYYMAEKLTLKYSEASLQYQQGKNSALETMKKCQEVALFCDCHTLANMISQEIAEIQTRTQGNKN